jgi:non-ribosomal peptide synthetase component E (peptide arylation enzyme)
LAGRNTRLWRRSGFLRFGSTRLTLEQVRAFLSSERVTRSFWPERVECMDEFPMTPSGKVQKFRLREVLMARQLISAR